MWKSEQTKWKINSIGVEKTGIDRAHIKEMFLEVVLFEMKGVIEEDVISTPVKAVIAAKENDNISLKKTYAYGTTIPSTLLNEE